MDEVERMLVERLGALEKRLGTQERTEYASVPNGSFSAGIRTIGSGETLKDSDYTVLCNGTFTATLPTAAGISGRVYTIKNIGTGTVLVATTSSQTIDGVTSWTLSTRYDWITVQSDGSNWHRV